MTYQDKINKILMSGKTKRQLSLYFNVHWETILNWAFGRTIPLKSLQKKIDRLYEKYS